MNSEFFDALEMLEKTRGIPADYMIEKVENALQAAYKKEEGSTSVRVAINREKKTVKVYRVRIVVEEVTDPKAEISFEDAQAISKRYVLGSVVEEEVKTKNFGRISAQTAKQVIVQGIREAEKGIIIKDYDRKRDEIISAIVVKRDESTGDVVVDTGTSNALLAKADQIPGENLYVGDRLKVYVADVGRREDKGPVVGLSRTHPTMVKKMFEMSIPEIADGLVVIKNIAREPGMRTKIAVMSTDPNVDPVGACIGSRGLRIMDIVNELNGERIDIVNYSENAEEYIAAALAPAKVKNVDYDGEKSAKVLVDSDQLSLAIGKEGQNVRLAAKLTGYRIDIKSVVS